MVVLYFYSFEIFPLGDYTVLRVKSNGSKKS